MTSVKALRRIKAGSMVRKIMLAWLVAVLTEYMMLPRELRDLAKLDGLAQMSFGRLVCVIMILTAVLSLMERYVFVPGLERWGMVLSFAVLAIVALQAGMTWPFLCACLLILAVLTVFALWGWKRSPERHRMTDTPAKVWGWVTAVLAVCFFLFVSAWTVGRVYSFSTPTYDFGIFSQMFYHMKESGLPMTTVERDGMLSHFAVHVSPIYYLMLPFYCLVPTPAALQVLQAAVIASAVIPLWKLGKVHGLSGPQRTICCGILLLYPAFSGGTGYDIHENCFLTPLILWLLYGIDRQSRPITWIAAILTLTVKEDAAVYVAVVGLWVAVKAMLRYEKQARTQLGTGLAMIGAAVGWFVLVTGYLSGQGDGVMTYRYQNFMYDGSASLMTVVKCVLLNPMKAVFECVDADKLKFLAQTMLPLLGLPLLTRRYERYILLIPYVLVNLMPDYTYQHDIFFQYSFGSTAFLLYLTVVNASDMKINWQRIAAMVAAVAVSGTCFGFLVVPKAMYYPVQAVRHYEYYQNLRQVLAQIPKEASVAAGTFYTTELSQREILYDLRYCSWEHVLESEYVVLGVTSTGDYQRYAAIGQENGLENLILLLEGHGYEMYASVEGQLLIYRRINT